eukprot:CAMPEP_0184304556 /NCGR_PEP_ID=MMETSP1049-20130417/14039_1 /TAXON_ID=77928 /ORGANISM="Proteomonas sulcata, Strain CCMP704" /LENGTH=44 /DNA_ID= /DNA_START= /DNA_END= /DNA_ORIENTATION=
MTIKSTPNPSAPSAPQPSAFNLSSCSALQALGPFALSPSAPQPL